MSIGLHVRQALARQQAELPFLTVTVRVIPPHILDRRNADRRARYAERVGRVEPSRHATDVRSVVYLAPPGFTVYALCGQWQGRR